MAASEVEVERLTAVLEATGLSTFAANMAAADRVTASTSDRIDHLAYVSKAAGEALQKVKLVASQAAETGASADFMRNALTKVAATADEAAQTLDRVRLGSGAAFETAANGEVISRSMRGIGDSADEARGSIERLVVTAEMAKTATGGSGGGGGGGGLLGALGWGGGRFGMAQFGSLLGLAGFGAERAITSTLGIGGSMMGALAGGGLLALGAGGTMAVGMGTDLAGIGQAAGDIKTVTGDITKLQDAIQKYGRASSQAAAAQAQLNSDLGEFSPVARGAVLAAAKTAQQFRDVFDQVTGQAEKVGAEIINQAMKVGEKFLPTIGRYAAQNMGIIQRDLQPLFAWLDNPSKSGGLGIFRNLEQIFQNNLPTSVHALTQGVELFAKTVDVAAQYTGGFVQKLNELLTRWNAPAEFQKWAGEIGKLIGLFDTWLHLFTTLGGAIFELFRPAIGFGQQFAAGLTAIIEKVKQWLGAAGMQDVLHTLFAAHLAQLQALFQLLQALLPVIEQTIAAFLRIEAAVSSLVAGPLKLLADLVGAITRFPLADKIMGWVFAFAIARKAIEGVQTAAGLLKVALIGLGPAAATGAAEAEAALGTMDTAVATSTADVGLLRKGLLALGASDVLASLGGVAASVAGLAALPAVAGYTFFSNGGDHVIGTTKPGRGLGGESSVILQNGQLYERGRTGTHLVSAAQAAHDLGISLQKLKEIIDGTTNGFTNAEAAAKARHGAGMTSLLPQFGGVPQLYSAMQGKSAVQAAMMAAQQFGIDPDTFLALVRQESGFNQGARSPKGAIGLTQLMPGTASGLGVDPNNPYQNLIGGAKYLSDQLRSFNGNMAEALAAYNAGPNAVMRAIKQGGPQGFLNFLPKETQAYVNNIMGASAGSYTSQYGTPSAAGVSATYGSTTARSAALAAQTLAQQVKQIRSALTGDTTQISRDSRQGLLGADITAQLDQQAAAIRSALNNATKADLPTIRKNLSALKAAITEGLAQAADVRKLDQFAKTVKDDLHNKLISDSDAKDLQARIDVYNRELTDKLLSPEQRRAIEQNIAQLKSTLHLDLTLETERRQLNGLVSQLNEAVGQGLFPTRLRDAAKKQAELIGEAIAEGTDAGAVAAKEHLATLKTIISQGVKDATTISAFQTKLYDFATQLQTSMRQTLGLPDVYASPQAMSAAEQAGQRIAQNLAKGLITATQAQKMFAQIEPIIESGLNGLERRVQTAVSAVQTAFSAVQSQMDAAFQQQTTAMEQRLGVQYFQNGLQTPSEKLLSQMQAQDTLNQYLDAIKAANASGDQTQIAKAQRDYQEYLLGLKAAKERAAADSAYTKQIQILQQQRAAAETQMNADLATLAVAFASGTGSMDQLQAIAEKYGITVDKKNIPDFQNLSSATKTLTLAIGDLIDAIAKAIGTTPGMLAAQSQESQWFTSASKGLVNAYVKSGKMPSFASGGATGAGGLAMLHDGEYVVPKGGTLVSAGGSRSGQVTVALTVQALDPRSVDWNQVGDAAVDGIYRALLRKKRDTGTLGLS